MDSAGDPACSSWLLCTPCSPSPSTAQNWYSKWLVTRKVGRAGQAGIKATRHLKWTVHWASRAAGLMPGCGPCKSQCGCLGPQLQPPLPLLSPSLLTHLLPSPSSPPPAPTQLAKQAVPLSRSPRPKSMDGTVSLGHKIPTSPALGSGPRVPEVEELEGVLDSPGSESTALALPTKVRLPVWSSLAHL